MGGMNNWRLWVEGESRSYVTLSTFWWMNVARTRNVFWVREGKSQKSFLEYQEKAGWRNCHQIWRKSVVGCRSIIGIELSIFALILWSTRLICTQTRFGLGTSQWIKSPQLVVDSSHQSTPLVLSQSLSIGFFCSRCCHQKLSIFQRSSLTHDAC